MTDFTNHLDIRKGANRLRLLPDTLNADIDLNARSLSGTIALVSDLPANINTGSSGDVEIFWDALSIPGTSGGDVTILSSGGTTTNVVPDADNRQGVIQFGTGTVATNRIFTGSVATTISVSSGRLIYSTDIRIPTLSTSTERFQFLAGFFGTQTAITQANGVYFLYDEGGASTGSTASANWQLVTTSNSIRTYQVTSIPIVANTWYNLTLDINASGTSVLFYINGTLVGTITTNIPNTIARAVSFGNFINKTVGTTARTYQVDWIYFRRSFITNRQLPGLLGSGNFTVYQPSSVQSLTATSTISPNAETVQISSASNITLTSSIQIANGVNAQRVRIYNSGSFNIGFSEGNNLFLDGTLILAPGRFADFQYIGGLWRLGLTNGTLSLIWTNLTLLNSFAVIGGYQTPQYARRGDRVFLRGVCQRSSSGLVSNTAITNLPAGFRPPVRIIFPQPTSRLPNADIDVDPSGDVVVFFQSTLPATIFPALDVVSFSTN